MRQPNNFTGELAANVGTSVLEKKLDISRMTTDGRLCERSVPIAVQMASDFAAMAEVDADAEEWWNKLMVVLCMCFELLNQT